MLSFFPRDVLDEIWDLIESVYEGFLPNILFWLFTGLRCSVWLYFVILLDIRIEKKR